MLDKWPVVYRDHIKDMVTVPIRAGVMPCTQEQFDAFVDEQTLQGDTVTEDLRTKSYALDYAGWRFKGYIDTEHKNPVVEVFL